MLRAWVRVALFCMLATECLGAGVRTVPASTGAWEAAFAAESPYAELMEAGLPLPPTREDAARLSAVEFVQQQTALKQVLLARNVRAFEEQKRISDANLRDSARMAEELSAPAPLAVYLRLLASDTLSSRRRYLVQTALDRLVESYLVDELQIRYFVEFAALSEEDLETLLKWLPLQAVFNLVPIVKDESVVAADYQLLRSVYEQLLVVYQSAQDRESADAAADAAMQAFILHESTAYTRIFAPQELKERFAPLYGQYLIAPALALQGERKRLRENDYYGSLRLRLLDLLLG